jgi:hypothetical protein
MAVEEESGQTSREPVGEELRAVAGLLGVAASRQRFRTAAKTTLTVSDVDEAIQRLTTLRERLEEETG